MRTVDDVSSALLAGARLVAQRPADLGLQLGEQPMQAARQAGTSHCLIVGEEAREQLVEQHIADEGGIGAVGERSAVGALDDERGERARQGCADDGEVGIGHRVAP